MKAIHSDPVRPRLCAAASALARLPNRCQVALAFALILALSSLLAGCNGLPTGGEEAARAQLQETAASYRPGGRKPELPNLTTNASIADFLEFAMLNQPAVESAYFDWAASIERITTARSLADPQLTFQMDIQNIVSSVMPGLMMNFPGPGKLRAGAEVASARSQSRYFAFQSAVLSTSFDVKRVLYQLELLDKKLRINRETLALLSDLSSLASAQNEVGKGTLQDILRAQIEQDRLKSVVGNLEDSRGPLLAQFKAVLGLPADAVLPPVPLPLDSTSLDLTPEELFQTTLENNTRLKGMESEVRAADAAIVLANKGRVPDFSVGLMADVKMNPLLYRPTATVTLPIWRDKIAAQIAEAQANKKAAAARLSAEQIALAVDFADRLYFYREATRDLELLQNQLLPKARQSLEVARSGYLAGQIDFFNLMDTERTLLGFQLGEAEARMQRELALAELSLIGMGMPPASGGTLRTDTAVLSAGTASTPATNMKGGM